MQMEKGSRPWSRVNGSSLLGKNFLNFQSSGYVFSNDFFVCIRILTVAISLVAGIILGVIAVHCEFNKLSFLFFF